MRSTPGTGFASHGDSVSPEPVRRLRRFPHKEGQSFPLPVVPGIPSQRSIPVPSDIADRGTDRRRDLVRNNGNESEHFRHARPRRESVDDLPEYRPGPGSDQIFGTADDGTVNSIGADLLSFIPTSATGTANITADNSSRPE